MGTLYFLAFIPLLIGAVLWLTRREIVLWEWLAATGVGLLTVGIMHLAIYQSLVADEVTISGQISQATFHPWWREEYTVEVCHTEGSGKNEHEVCHTEYRTREHDEYWDSDTNIGSSHRIDKDFYDRIVQNFGGVKVPKDDSRYGLINGDRNVYVTYNRTGFIYPVTDHKYWANPVKASKSLFKYGEVPKGIKVFPYPKNENWTQSDRLLGRARQDFSINEIDKLNAVLGPMKKVNLIVVGFGPDTTEDNGDYQESAWGGGKENDLVITYGGPDNSKWVHVFGWTEKDIVKSNLETLFLLNPPSNNLLPQIKNEVILNYQLKDFSKFNYLSIDAPWWAWIVVTIVVLLVQGGFWYMAFNNEFDKNE